MNKEKSDQYRNLVAKVKEKYKSYTISNDKITLGWCDLLPDEDLCREINLWTYWQGWNYAEHTPIIKYMLLGQDFGPPDKEEQKGTIDNVRLLNEQGRAKKNVMFHDGAKRTIHIKEIKNLFGCTSRLLGNEESRRRRHCKERLEKNIGQLGRYFWQIHTELYCSDGTDYRKDKYW